MKSRLYNNIKKAYCFDFDETLVTTEARIHVYRNGAHVKEMNSKEYNFYKPNNQDELDFSDFNDPELILNAQKYKMWPILRNISKAIKEKRSSSDIYILTARSTIVKSTIYEFLKLNGINIHIDNVITIGDDKGKVDISREKRKWLSKLATKYEVMYFFDDDPKNIRLASDIKGICTRLVEDMGGVSAPMSTLVNTPGMGNVVPPGPGTIGSGDNFGAINKRPYTQGNPLKKKRKKKKIIKEDMNEGGMEVAASSVANYYLDHRGRGVDYSDRRSFKQKIKDMIAERKINIIAKRLASIPEIQEIAKNQKYAKKYQGQIKKIISTYLEEDEMQYLYGLNIPLIQKYMHMKKDMNEENINPYDKMGMAMAKKMKVKPPFKKKKEKGNQNAMMQQKFEHQIITFDEFVKQLNENI